MFEGYFRSNSDGVLGISLFFTKGAWHVGQSEYLIWHLQLQDWHVFSIGANYQMNNTQNIWYTLCMVLGIRRTLIRIRILLPAQHYYVIHIVCHYTYMKNVAKTNSCYNYVNTVKSYVLFLLQFPVIQLLPPKIIVWKKKHYVLQQ